MTSHEMEKHTPTQWRVRYLGPKIQLANGGKITLEVFGDSIADNRDRRDTADRFVRAVNSHDELCTVIELMLEHDAAYGKQNAFDQRARAALALARNGGE